VNPDQRIAPLRERGLEHPNAVHRATRYPSVIELRA
jgi:hypothetical protein